MTVMQPIHAYIFSFIIMVTVMLIPNSVTMRAVKSSWYQCIRPEITPPNYVFPIVWTILYICIGISLSQTLLLRDSEDRTILLCLYTFNLIMNVLWSLVYFGIHDTITAMFILGLLILSTSFILWYTYLLLPSWVFYILIPYLLWLCFAGVLNFLSTQKKC